MRPTQLNKLYKKDRQVLICRGTGCESQKAKAIYTALDRLARKGLVLSELGDPTPVRGGRRKRHYELTPQGLEKVREAKRIRERMWDRVAPELLGEEASK